jgi:hypothetical protein
MASNAQFEVVTPKDYPEKDFDLVAFSTICTTWATRRVRQRMSAIAEAGRFVDDLRADGGDRIEVNLNPFAEARARR